MSASHDTSDAPSLPPLALSSHPEFTLAPPPPILPGNVSSDILRSPTPSVAESYSTAYTSTSTAGDTETNLLGPYSLAPLQSLRKSISVDSFVHYNRDDPQSNSSLEPVRNQIYGLSIDTQLPPVIPNWPSRSRGESLSSIQQDQEPSFPLDHDVDRSYSLPQPAIERVRLQSLKTPDSPVSPGRGGDLRLPSRTSTTTAPNHAERGYMPSVSSTSSLQSSSRGGSTYATQPAARLRSGSLGYNMPSKRTVLSHHIPQPVNTSVSKNNNDVVVVVIGSSGCGKSTVIKRGLSAYGLVKSEVGLPEPSNADGILRYTRRIGKFITDQQTGPPGGAFPKIEVIEVEVQETGANPLSWPQEFPPVDGVIICYDASDRSSYKPVDGLLRAYRTTPLPVMVLGCKADLEREIEPYYAMKAVKQYDTGLIEVSHVDESGKAKMKRSFEYLLKAILRQRGPNRVVDNRNPATPDLLPRSSVAEDSWTKSPITPSSAPMTVVTDSSNPSEPSPSTPTADSISPTSPNEQTPLEHLVNATDAPSTQSDSQEVDPHDSDDAHHNDSDNSPNIPQDLPQRPRDDKKAKKEPRPSQWANLEDLLDKLLFLAVSGDDPTFATHFLLTYRRFTTPRTVLLAMQKRMRLLDHPSGDPMFACFAQMRICHLLETWIHDYAHDFTVKGTTGALNALIKSIISKTHLLHYGPELLSFLERLPSLVDEDSAWAVKAEVSDVDSDDYTPEDEDEAGTRHKDTASSETASVEAPGDSPKFAFPLRERKASLPLPRVFLSAQINGNHTSSQDSQPKQYIKELVKLANDVMNADAEEIAQEITRQSVELFMAIKPRDWLNYTFISKKKPDEPITKFNLMSSHLADWVVSLILCHERPRYRARQIEKFVEIGTKLRTMNNYSALRAFVAGINNANDEATMEAFKARVPELAKNLRSWDLLLQQVRAHRAYRLALRNSKGSCIPALEVHILDLIKAHEGNDDTNPAFPSKIHWGKFNMMGRFVTTTIHCQNQCRNSNDYNFSSRPHIDALLHNRCAVMTTEMQKSRLKSQVTDDYEDTPPSGPPPPTKEHRKMIFFW